jgi:pre-mRNA-splicing factor SYF1
MLRIKRSVQAQYNTDVNFIASQALARGQAKESAGEDQERKDAMEALERQAKAPQGFVAASTGVIPGNVEPANAASPAVAANPDAIDLDMED